MELDTLGESLERSQGISRKNEINFIRISFQRRDVWEHLAWNCFRFLVPALTVDPLVTLSLFTSNIVYVLVICADTYIVMPLGCTHSYCTWKTVIDILTVLHLGCCSSIFKWNWKCSTCRGQLFGIIPLGLTNITTSGKVISESLQVYLCSTDIYHNGVYSLSVGSLWLFNNWNSLLHTL